MDLLQLLLKIDNEDFEIIQEEARVQYDNKQQCPLGFLWRKKHFEVLDLYRVTVNEGGNINFLVLTDGGIFNLVLVRDSREKGLSRSRWVIFYKVNMEQGYYIR